MVIVTCAPCLASTVAPVAAGTLAALGLRKNKKGGSGYETQEEYEQMNEPTVLYEPTVLHRQTSQELRNNALKRKIEMSPSYAGEEVIVQRLIDSGKFTKEEIESIINS